MELIYTDSEKNDVGLLEGAVADMAYGDDENRFTVEISADSIPAGLGHGSLVYAEGTEWGGRVTRIRTITADGSAVFGGRTWHGMLADRIVMPPAGADHYRASGEANACIRALLQHCGLSDTFSASYDESGIVVPDHSFERFCDAYSGLRKMLASGGGKLKIRSESPKPMLYAAPIVDWSAVDDVDATQVDIDAQIDYCPVNHLVCAGIGEGTGRIVVHLYANSAGDVSRAQSIFGDDEVQEFYDYPNAGEGELIEKGTERLKSYQNPRSGDLSLDPSVEYDVGDVVGRSDPYTGVEVASTVSKAILRLSDRASVTYELGETQTAQARGSVAESSGGVSYVAGDNVTITGRTISAEVGSGDLAVVEGVARDAAAAASNASAAAGAAQDAAGANVAGVEANQPLEVARDGQDVTLSHATSGVAAGAYGPASDAAPGWGDTVAVGARTSVDATGHVTGMQGRTVTIPDAEATASARGLMSASDKARLDAYPWADVAGKPAAYPPSAHTHAYAGSATAGGSATSAVKLAAPRTITLSGAVKGSAKFDGSSDITITTDGDSEAAGFLSAHPIMSYYETENGANPAGTYGGSWVQVPSLGAYKWKRTG